MNDRERMLEALKRTDAYPQRADFIEERQTHISHLFLTQDRVYKIKKDVRFPFVDYSTLEKRRKACESEVALNRRLAPDVYLGVLPIRQSDVDRFTIDGEGTTVEYCVAMTRLPEKRMLDHLLLQGQATAEHRTALLQLLIPFYQRAQRGPDLDRYATADVVRRHVQENLETLGFLDALPELCYGRVCSSQLQYLTAHEELFNRRIQEGRVCDGHGDLRPEHVCLTDPPATYDCVEFSTEFRAGDVVSEIAFLAMECDFLGAKDWAQALATEYCTLAGDDCPPSLVEFYKAYRACVRAKVEVLRAEQDATQAESCLERARKYVQLASFYAAEFHQPFLWVTVGISGSGKSVLSRELNLQTGAQWLRTDAVRQELAGRREPGRKANTGIYTPEMTQRTYQAVFDRAQALLKDSNSVILDGTFSDRRRREQARELAKKVGVPVRFLYCDVPLEVAQQRIRARRKARTDISDASEAIADQQSAALLQDAADLDEPEVLHLDMTASPASLFEAIRCDLRRSTREA